MSILNEITDALKNGDVNTLGIYGIGGIGKTTLAKEVARRAENDKLFDQVVFSEVSESQDIRKIQREIGDKLGLKFDEESESGRARRLHDRLKKEKRILVILDNIWGNLDLKAAGIPHGDDHRGCKVLLTARSLDTLSTKMDSQKNFSVSFLKEEEAWSLFKKMAGDYVEGNELKEVARDVAKECAGLPVAIVTVATALRDNNSLFDWKDALEQLRRPSSTNRMNVQPTAYKAIKLSYDKLAGEELKNIFLLIGYTAIASIDDLLMYGMGMGLFQDDKKLQLQATTLFRRLLSFGRNSPIEKVIQSGVVPRFVEFLMREDHPQLQFEAACALTNIASGTSENTKVVIDHGAVPIFVKLLASPSDDVREQAVWALGNVAGDSPRCRDLVLSQGALIPLLAELNEHAKLSMLRTATWTLSNFCRGKPQPPFNQIRPALPVLAQLIRSNDEKVLTDACWALAYLADGTNDKIQAVIEAGVCPQLVTLLGHPSPSVLTPALRTVGNIATGDDFQTQGIINCGALPYFLDMLVNNRKESIKKEVCWVISNITAGNREQIQAVINAGLIGPLVNLLQNAEFYIKKEAAWAISNASSGGTHEQIKYLVRTGCIKPLCDLLLCPDPGIVTVCLTGLENILEVGEAEKNMGTAIGNVNQHAQLVEKAEGLEKIENLQSHDSNEIHEKSVKILETYWRGRVVGRRR
ncbi:hypothetical protein WN944_007269 [Citrus x changshan-huyou]|uniref:NB-ARC domain-containing protein n=1 Tax=Citrus x changshan-huyou TaxID=2935761 RepID=A0AAP0QU87_9ROSI